jgi:hypothetical protein
MSIFPTKILLASDGSKEAELAATSAADLARSTPAQSDTSSASFPALLTYTPTTKSASQKRPNACGVRLESNAKRCWMSRSSVSGKPGNMSPRRTAGREKRPRR